MYKLPYIPDKKLYAAVMGACSYVRATGYFNKATRFYANKYDVDVEEVRRYARIAQGNGQKMASKAKKVKYHWFAVEYSISHEHDGTACYYFEPLLAHYKIRKGMTADSVKRTMGKELESRGLEIWFGRVEPFDMEDTATETAHRWESEAAQKRELELGQHGTNQG